MDRILLSHGDGGLLTYELLREYFLPRFRNEILESMTDAALIGVPKNRIAVTIDSFVVDPIFFPGGDIGKLSIYGTVNDLAVSGAKPLFVAASFILEEGFPIPDLERIVKSMEEACKKASVKIVCGDTKVVGKNQADKIFITTTGIGYLYEHIELGYEKIEENDSIIVNGSLGNHGLAILLARESFDFEVKIESDTNPLNHIIEKLLTNFKGIKFMRDLTRGGLVTCLKEIALSAKKDFYLIEESIPFDEKVKGVSELLGLDPLYLANEGKFAIIAKREESEGIVEFLRKSCGQEKAAIVGFVKKGEGEVFLKTKVGGTRRLRMLLGDPLPRIC